MEDMRHLALGKGRGHHLSGGVESKKPETVEASQTRRTDRKRLFDSGGKIGDAALSAEMRGTRLWQLQRGCAQE